MTILDLQDANISNYELRSILPDILINKQFHAEMTKCIIYETKHANNEMRGNE